MPKPESHTQCQSHRQERWELPRGRDGHVPGTLQAPQAGSSHPLEQTGPGIWGAATFHWHTQVKGGDPAAPPRECELDPPPLCPALQTSPPPHSMPGMDSIASQLPLPPNEHCACPGSASSCHGHSPASCSRGSRREGRVRGLQLRLRPVQLWGQDKRLWPAALPRTASTFWKPRQPTSSPTGQKEQATLVMPVGVS